MAASPGCESLREQLCQIEQSLGVCHIAEVQAWPRPRRPHDGFNEVVQSGSALLGSQQRLSPPKDPTSRSTERSRGESGRQAAGRTNAVHQPLPPKQAVASKLISVPCVPQTASPATERHSSEETDLDSDLVMKLDEAVDKLIRGSVRRLAFGTESPEKSRVVELGPTSAPKEQGASLLKAAPRLPQQLAEIRKQLRQLSEDCDRMQALATEGPSFEEEPLESVEAEHASTMSQANQLLEAVSGPLSADIG
ncbi:hypothetical protein AK812_SmicGene23509 [Symbiodinium microadriaticum]|uniref:Uncharacterized protein n=1 Tax=Symbiodinium microadriaticum TaxID=2951 RepID=A0A1Q9DH25_SYMMI|nr:hypothetical protein AK812_SmicGene23509 [Symbiodinium microadriaticum]CAE7231688.1 unnamed protein product [Symbiodinium microadriaticum]CAE7334726.1 unnamed protein product [Symbiodinium sp. KB8]